MNTSMNKVTVYCGDGGDYEFERDRVRWTIWIAEHITGCGRVGYYTTVGFKITPHKEADKAIIQFDNPHNATLFALKAPEYTIYTSRNICLTTSKTDG